MECVVDREPAGGKVDKFLSTFESNGVALKESERYIKAKPSDQLRMEKPWELVVEWGATQTPSFRLDLITVYLLQCG